MFHASHNFVRNNHRQSLALALVIAAGLTAAVYHGTGYLIGAIYGGAMKAYRAKHTPAIPKPPGWPATPARLNPGNPGTFQCRQGSCWLQRSSPPTLVGGTPAGSMRSFFRDQLDCRDRSFNRIGDTRVPGNVSRGWQPVENDPTALAVAQTWCPRIEELSRKTGEH